MSQKIDAVRRHFAAMRTKLYCPLCRLPLAPERNGFCCPRGHCFDLSARNYLNIAPHKKQAANKYSATLFAARRQIFAEGFYAPLMELLLARCREHMQSRGPQTAPSLLLDAGCGEGFFSAGLLRGLAPADIEVCALDLAREGVKMAAGLKLPGLFCLIGDLARLPLADQSVDILLNVLSPANYAEFRRVLKPDGLLLKVTPGPAYLREMRRALRIPPRHSAEDESAMELWRQTFGSGRSEALVYQRSLSPQQAAAFLQMSPLSFAHNTQAADLTDELTEVTIDLRLLSANA